MSKSPEMVEIGTHSPGPWRVSENMYYVKSDNGNMTLHYGARIHTPATPLDLASLQCSSHCENGISQTSTRADAHLIAAAPELLEALRYAWSQCRHQCTEGAERLMRAAIAKAEGRQ
jgi:hypothetical protein